MPIVAVTSGTSGVGKTTVATNLASVLGRLRRRVVLVDATPAPSSLTQWLGITTEQHPVRGPHGIQVLAPRANGASGSISLDLIDALASDIDFVVVDTAADDPDLVGLLSRVDDIVIVTSAERRVTDRTYGLVRRASAAGIRAQMGVVVNAVEQRDDGERAYQRVAESASHGLGRSIESYGVVPVDPDVPRAQMTQQAVVDYRPAAPSSRCFEALGWRLAHGGPSGGAGLSLFPNLRKRWPTPRSLRRRRLEARQCA